MSDKFISASEIRELLGIAPDGDCEKCRRFRGRFGCQQSSDFMRVCEAIDDCSAADVRPVVRGEWIVDDHGDYQLIECDQCHAQMWNHQSELPNYCHNCGSDMRKVVEIDQVKEGDT